MAKYRNFTNEQYKDFCMTMLLLSHTDQYLQEWMPPERQLKLTQASKLISDVIVETVQELSRESALRLKKNVESVQLFCLPKPEAERAMRHSKKTNIVRITEEAFHILLESSLQHCKYPCGRNYKQCPLRKIALETGAPKWDSEARGYCPYEQRYDTKGDDKKN
jgi:hypothetical protein